MKKDTRTILHERNAKAKHFNDGDEWMLAEAFPDIDFFFCQVWLRAFVNKLDRSCGRNYKKILAVFDGAKRNHVAFYYGKRDCLEFTRALVKKIVADPSFGELINANIREYSDALVKHAETIPSQDALTRASNAELWEIVRSHVEAHDELYAWGWLSNATDMFYPEYTNYLKQYLRAKTSDETKINEWLVTLTSPDEKSVEARQHEEFLRLATRLWRDEETRKLFANAEPREIIAEITPEERKAIEAFAARYAVIGALYVAEPFPLEHYASELKTVFGNGLDPECELAEQNAALEKRKLQKRNF